MSSKLGRFCEGIMEAAWITALIVAPVFFNIYSSRIFEPDKISIVRSLAVIILFAWFVKLIEERGKFSQLNIKDRRWLKEIFSFPLFASVIALAGVMITATIFSVSPRVSLWGSYQRLQGLYTTISYLVIFASIVGNLRQREQVQRLITVGIISSIPVSLYGIIQRYHLDPIPWGGDVSVRIASNMGNSIFVAAFLIMVIPVTVVRISEAIEGVLKAKNVNWVEFVQLVGYTTVFGLQLAALYFSGSRGPWLGALASMFFLWLGFSIHWRQKWMSIAGVLLASFIGLAIILLNIPGGPLENLRQKPEFGRLGQLLDAESRTGRVRSLIWQGAAELVLPHDPIEFPDSSKDRFNSLRPIIGYGPESMYVAYNPFYPPALTQVEKRNASPDRSHNETWDALVTTGLAGLAVYLILFSSVLFFGLKWLGLIQNTRMRNLFFLFYLGWSLIFSIIFLIWKGIPFLGVALPSGMIFGFLFYLSWISLFARDITLSRSGNARSYILLGLLAAILAHFFEINFGIAIVSTRIYFWVFSALLLTTGKILPEIGEFGFSNANPEDISNRLIYTDPAVQSEVSTVDRIRTRGSKSTIKQGRRKKQISSINQERIIFNLPIWIRQALVFGLISAMLLSTLGFLYITNSSRSPSVISTIWNSITVLIKDSQARSSTGIIMLFLSTTILSVALLFTESSRRLPETKTENAITVVKLLGLEIVIALTLGLLFWFVHASKLVSLSSSSANTIEDVLVQVKKSEGIISNYYAYMFWLLLLMAFTIIPTWPAKSTNGISGLISALLALIIAIFLVVYSNLRIIQADMTFKTADIFDQQSTWPVAIRIYERANELAKNEDYYYLFLGRAYLEYARSLNDPIERDQLFDQAANDLRQAQSINPLNPDHTANLARLHSLWAVYTSDPGKRQTRAQISDDYFSRAVILKPKDAKLWDEWAVLYLNVLDEPGEALKRLKVAQEIDPYYDWTFKLLGDYTQRYVVDRTQPESEEWKSAMEQAAEYYQTALKNADVNNKTSQFDYTLSLAEIQSQLGQVREAIQTYEMAISILPENSENWKIYETLARLYKQIGDENKAISNALTALEMAPDDQKSRIQEFISSMGG